MSGLDVLAHVRMQCEVFDSGSATYDGLTSRIASLRDLDNDLMLGRAQIRVAIETLERLRNNLTPETADG